MRCNLCHPDDWVDKPDPQRPGWIRTHCKRCKRYLGSRDPTKTGELEQQARPLEEKAKPRRKRPAKKQLTEGATPMTLETLRTFGDLGRAPKEGERVLVVYRLEDTTGMLVNPRHLGARSCGARGYVNGWVAGHGGDLWWVTHDDGAVAVYLVTEIAPEPMKVFQLNDYEWYMAPTLEAAVAEAMKITGMPREDVLDEACSGEVDDAELDRLMFNEEDGTRRTFREELARRIADGGGTQHFAAHDC